MFDNTKLEVMSEKVDNSDLKLGTSFTAGKRARNFLGIHWRGLAMFGAVLAWGAVTFATGGAAGLLGGVLGANYMVPTLVGSAGLFFLAGALPFRKSRKAAITQNKIARIQRKVDRRVKSFQKEHQLFKNYENHLINLAENADLSIKKVSRKYTRSNKRMMRHLKRMLKHQKATDSLASGKIGGLVNKMKVDSHKYLGNVRDAEYNAFEMTYALSQAHNGILKIKNIHDTNNVEDKTRKVKRGEVRGQKRFNTNINKAKMNNKLNYFIDLVGGRVREFGTVDQKLYERDLTEHVEKRRKQRLNPFPERKIVLDGHTPRQRGARQDASPVVTGQETSTEQAPTAEPKKPTPKPAPKPEQESTPVTPTENTTNKPRAVNKRRGAIYKSCNQYKVISLNGKKVFNISDNSLLSAKTAFDEAEKNNQELNIKFVLDKDGHAEIKDYALKP